MRASLTIRAGLSVGWADNYPWIFAFQWIDITGLPGGIYRARVTVDIQDYYDEKIETDNCVWAKIRIPAPGSTARRRSMPTADAATRRHDSGQQLRQGVTGPASSAIAPGRTPAVSSTQWARSLHEASTVRTSGS